MEKIMNFKTIGIGIALTCGTFAVGSTVGVSPAQAAFLNIVGTSDFEFGNQNTPANETIWFKNSKVESFGGALFAGLTEGSKVTVSDVKLTNPTAITTSGTETTAKYTGNAINPNPFLSFLSDPSLTFKIDNPFTVTRNRDSAFNTTDAKFNFFGAFYKGGTFLSKGIVTGNEIYGAPGSYSMTINTPDVPEPLTILGSITALGMGAALRKKQAQKQAREKVTA